MMNSSFYMGIMKGINDINKNLNKNDINLDEMAELNNNNVKKIIENNGILALENSKNEIFLYYDKFRVLIPEVQNSVSDVEGVNLNGHIMSKILIKQEHAVELFSKLKKIKKLYPWNISSRVWAVGDYIYDNSVYNGRTGLIEKLAFNGKCYALKVIYLPEESYLKEKINFSKYGLSVSDYQPEYENYTAEETSNEHKSSEAVNNSSKSDEKIEELLNCDKKRCGLPSYEKEILYDIKSGHWDIFENADSYKEFDDKLVSRNPEMDIKKNGVIGIDFGTKSTVVVKQENRNEIRPLRIGSLSLGAEVAENDYENPTIISCLDINSFLEKYMNKSGRPDTSCNDLFVSYNAYEEYKNCSTDNFYAYYSDLKQWANSEKGDVLVQDVRKKSTYRLSEECSVDNKTINPIEIYAYYIGMYINNMRNGIYMKYIMSFPVKYSKNTKELIRKSFEKGLKKSLPKSIVDNEELMKKFSVDYHISEPAAYAVTVLEQLGFKPHDENKKYLYGIFDFGGGTTDFDFGVWRGASDEEYDKYNCDYVLECFGADSDVRLGGENILEMLAYQVFKYNKKMAADKKIACALPAGQIPFIGSENLINNSQSANRNLTILKEAFRPLWEQHDGWEKIYYNNDEKDDAKKIKQYIECQMYDLNSKAVPNCKFEINTDDLLNLIKQRIKKGVDAFFYCIEKSILGNKKAQTASEKIYIFLAGNSCKSVFVKEIFEETIEKYNKEYSKIGNNEQERFELIAPLKGSESDSQYVPNGKTSVAYGLVKSRPGGKIYIMKNYETNSDEETKFRYYLGSDRRGNFVCKLSPVIKSEDGQNISSYNVWHKFQGAGIGISRIYYTENPSADSKAEKLLIDDIPFHEISFEPDEDKYLFIRAVKPSVIEYTVASSAEEIDGNIFELDIENS